MNPTNSRLEISFACRLSNCLPEAREVKEHTTAGTVGHRFLQRIVELQTPAEGREPFALEEAVAIAIGEADDLHRDALRLIPLESLQQMELDPTKCVVEVAIAYDVATDTARELGRGMERDYGALLPTEYVGTTDYAALVGMEGARIRDYKLGWGKQVPAARSVQLKKCALDFCRAYGRAYADVEILRAPPGVRPWYDKARFNAYDLDSFSLQLQQHHERIQNDRESYRQGDLPPADLGEHCTYCPGARYCPAQAAIAKSVCGDSGELQALVRAGKDGAVALITPDNAPRLLELYRRGTKVLEILGGALNLYAAQDPIPQPDGKVYGPRPDRKRELVNVAIAKQVIAKQLGEAYVQAALAPEEISMTGVERARAAYFKDHETEKKVKGAVGKMDELLEEELVKAGALRIYQGATFTTFKPKEK